MRLENRKVSNEQAQKCADALKCCSVLETRDCTDNNFKSKCLSFMVGPPGMRLSKVDPDLFASVLKALALYRNATASLQL